MQILAPIEWVVAWVIYGAHQVFTFIGFPEGPGWAWVLSVVMLTVVMRAAMIPLFVKQIKATRGQQLIQPEIQAIQAKYKGKTDPASREALSRETMALYKENGTNPFSSCLPILLQSPIFFALFRVLNAIGPIAYGERDGIGPITQSLAFDIQGSSFFGARLSDTFMATDSWPTRIVIIVLILLMSASTFYTQRQLTRKNMPAASLQGPAANMQKMMLYVFPLIFMISGVNFPVGVLIYWTVTNLWSMGQQYYTIKRMPNPGTDAERELKEKRARKAARKGIVLEPVVESTVVEPKGQRQQPQRKNRSKKS